MPGAMPDGEPVPADGTLPESAVRGLGERPFGIYVHVPFCTARCGYCDFNTYTAAELGGTPGSAAVSVGSYPALAIAVSGVTSPQIRAMGTVGGDLCQRPRCWYYRSGFGLLGRDAGGRSMPLEGDNRYHAILGNQGPA